MAVSKVVLGLIGATAVAGAVTVGVVASRGSSSKNKVAAASSSSSPAAASGSGARGSSSSSAPTATTTASTVAAPLPDPSCQQEPSLKSIAGTATFNLTFVNNTGETLQTLWLSYDGKRVFYRQIPAGTSYVQPTFITHPWIMADLAGTCLGLYVVDGGQDTMTVPIGSTSPPTSAPVLDAGPALGNPIAAVQASDALTFAPQNIDVRRNDIVEWDNTGTVGHNVTFDAPTAAPFNDLHLDAGGKWQVRFATAGSYTYTCTIHPGMDGTVVVH